MELIIVDDTDQVLGYESKEKCHQGDGIRHRAFSVFLFNGKKELLVQQRSAQKPLWPLYWSNSVCSHPVKDESCEQAACRRVVEEIGVELTPVFLFKFPYHARYKTVGSEKEFCSVFIGKSDADISANPEEIAAFKYMPIPELDREMEKNPDSFTPWFKIEWQRIKRNHLKDIEDL